MSTSIITVRSAHRIDGTELANATGAAANLTSAPRLTDASGTMLAWIAHDLDAASLTELGRELRGIFGAEAVTAVIVDTAAPAEQTGSTAP